MEITFENLLQFTKVQVLLYVAEKLAAQKKRSIDKIGCVNLTKDGLKCAVGHLIPQHILQEEFGDIESGPEDLMRKFYPDLDYFETKQWLLFLGMLRITHDNITPQVEIWHTPKDFLNDFKRQVEFLSVRKTKNFLNTIVEEALQTLN